MMLLKNLKDINLFQDAVDKCTSDVILRSVDGSEEFNLKSVISRFVAMGRLCEEYGDWYEVFCTDKNEEGFMLQFFHEIKN